MLAVNTASVWQANLDITPTEYLSLNSVLSEEEKQRVDHFHNPTIRQRAIIARGILRSLLSYFTGIPAHRLRFGYTPHGKPYLLDEPSIGFNLSHSQNKAIYVFALGTSVGIDLEYQNPHLKIERIARRCFSPQEYRDLHALPPQLKRQAFFTAWTQKEAILKALGFNLFFLPKIEVSIHEEIPCLLSVHEIPFHMAEWSLHNLSSPVHFSTALAIRAPTPTIELRDWN